ncbi:MAG TPA: glycogen debranching protein [Desulfobacteraceae bacterium]|nr:glycogen debranching protein [Desulfobacteraceae bacterium]
MNRQLYNIIQHPPPGTKVLMFRGDTFDFKLSFSENIKGTAWIRTNLGHADVARKEIIKQVSFDIPVPGRDWFDIPMVQTGDNSHGATLPLCDVGHFEAKCFFLQKGSSDPLWPEGTNVVINVEPADTCCANSIYNVFVRQFGPNKTSDNACEQSHADFIKKLDNAGYSVIPPSGTFRDLIKELDFILGELKCRYIHLLPIHPTPTTYGRMGRFGSPYAALSFTGIDPALASFDPCATPLEQFGELVDEIHKRNGRLILDIAINHTGWAADLHESHPKWLVRDENKRIEEPGAWGVTWSDLTRLDFSHKKLWEYMADIFLLWCRRGVSGFRCDAGYMVPVPAWEFIVASVRTQYPDTIFFLEGLGGKVSVTRDILNRANFNWAYSELFQNYDRAQIENYLPQADEISVSDGLTIHFAETHDNNRLAARSKKYASMRTGLCALFSHYGGFGFANGVEWFATEKINVHQSSCLNWGSDVNQVDFIQRLNILLRAHPAFSDKTKLEMIQAGDGNYLTLLRHHLPSGKKLLLLINLDDKKKVSASWDRFKSGICKDEFIDLLTGKLFYVHKSDNLCTCPLEPAQLLCLSPDKEDIKLTRGEDTPFALPKRIMEQRFKAKVLDIFRHYNKTVDMGDFDLKRATHRFFNDPEKFCLKMNQADDQSKVITWTWPKDIQREVMVPPGFFLLVRSKFPFMARINKKTEAGKHQKIITKMHEASLPCNDGSHFVLFLPMLVPNSPAKYLLNIAVYTKEKNRHGNGHILYLAPGENGVIKKRFARSHLGSVPLVFLGTNSRGSMTRVQVKWGELNSKYDALLAANLSKDFPCNRRIMLTRCRGWVVFQGYSRKISFDSFDSFIFQYTSKGFWRYKIPTGQGEYIALTMGLEIMADENMLRMVFLREPSENSNMLNDSKGIKLIIRPDVEDRDFHETTKAYTGPEHTFPASATPEENGFIFRPGRGSQLSMTLPGGEYKHEPQWDYMIHRPLEKERGMDSESDLFSPGYFSVFLNGNQKAELCAHISSDKEDKPKLPVFEHELKLQRDYPHTTGVEDALKEALDSYLVNRNGQKSVIAGYPWFLDWGRDSLIFTRGLIQAGRIEEAKSVLKLFGQFEKNGTLPNIILEKSVGNRDTADAQLWFFKACSDMTAALKTDDFLEEKAGNRTIREILVSMGHSLMVGTENKISMDPGSCLLFSPAHFTWMDTNYPAGTPRQGYCIEIQALWYAALVFLAEIDPGEKIWERMFLKAAASIHDYFILNQGYLSDCLHGEFSVPAKDAKGDDLLRPNQLFAITMGAIKDIKICRQILASCMELLIPGAIRSLADRRVDYRLEIKKDGHLLNDPANPYWGKYTGDEDTRRKPAYHNGTAWTWLFPSFCEAWSMIYGSEGKKTALAWLSSSILNINKGCAGHVPEIADGDFPHTPRGCDAQAWGVSELLRVWKIVNN